MIGATQNAAKSTCSVRLPCAPGHKNSVVRCCKGVNLTKLAEQAGDDGHSWWTLLIKTFLFGLLLGVAVAAGALYAVPVVDQHREISYVSVAPNGGNNESFHINIPVDRIMLGTGGQASGLPIAMEWPQDEILASVSAEIFKLRNERNIVVGVAARTVVREEGADILDWVLHLPARGTFMIGMEPAAGEGGYRIGKLHTGTQEFAKLNGFVTERWTVDKSGDEDAPDGRIELHATYVGQLEPVQ